MSIARIDKRFADLKAHNKSAFIAYIMAGDPDLETTFEILKGLPAAGADLIELGFPFSDPMAEGPTIQHAAERSLAAGTKLRDVFMLVKRFREIDQDTPIILMGYMNPVDFLGYERFAQSAADAGADGLIVVDCPPEEADALSDALDANDIALIRLATPTTDDSRLLTLVKRTRGFIYYVSVAGVTGVKSVDADAIAEAVSKVRDAANLPVAVGFGIRTPESAASVARIADAAVVGSALVDEIKTSLLENTPSSVKVLEKAAILAQAVHQARD
ncbi:Tryptophan synthase alpha chain [Asticcacaulis sp. MM231]|uniref:tryptophan synthase subunit alpha n=1 Tax=Asticcacaulis sp. MM231 TaxID=3157666 RepID=UPI0032D572DB